MNGIRTLSWMITTGWFALSAPSMTSGEPFLPQQDTQVLEHLSVKATDPVAREIRALRTSLLRDPQNMDVAVSLATKLIEQSRSEGDPRFLGQAQAVLAPWLNHPTPPSSTLLLGAMIRQHAHEFGLALADLDAVLSLQPANAQAWLTRASIYQVQGRYDEARRACQPLLRLAGRHVALTCLGDIAGLSGQAATSRQMLTSSLERPGVSARERLWILTILAEMAARTGDANAAEKHFLDARSLGVKDHYLLGAYADFLLDQGRTQEVVTLLQHEIRADGLLLRLTLAEQALHLPASKNHTAELAARFAAGRERGTRVHVREEARFTLALLHDPQAALTLAQTNWEIQKEPWDARLLLESALAVGSWNAARPVIDWLNTNRVEDRTLQQLVAQFPKEQS
ncbi:MAG: tetratricopeptide repeat protein [Nitrospirota bacterium]